MKKVFFSILSFVLAICFFAPQVIAFNDTVNYYSTKDLEYHWQWISGETGNNILKASENTTNININNAAFCLDNGKDAPAYSGTTGSYIGEVDNGILSIMYYGFPYRSAAELGATSDEVAYDATQMAIYAYQGTLHETQPAGLTQFNFLRDYNGNAVTVAKNILTNALNNPYTPTKTHNVTVTTNHSDVSIVGNYYYVGSYTVKVNDSNSSNYSVNLQYAPSGTQVVKSGSNFYFKIPTTTNIQNERLQASITSSGNPYLSCAMYNLGGNYQRMAKLEVKTPTGRTEIYKNFPDPQGKIEVLKKDNNNKLLSGAIFRFEHTTLGLSYDITTNAQGKAILEEAPYGVWKITEIQSPPGYILNSTPQYITLDDSNAATASITFLNEEKTGTLKVKKTTPGMVNLSDLVFVLTGTSDSGHEVNIEAITDQNGIATFNAVPIGTYTVTEKGSSVPYAYMVAEPETVSVQYAQTTNIEISNAEKTGSIKVKKTTPGMVNLSNLVFVLTGTSDTGREINMEATTDENGIATFNAVPIGTYTITEKGSSVPYAYMVADAEEVSVQYAQTTNIEISNAEKTGSIKVTKATRKMQDIANITFILHGTSDSGRDILIEAITDQNGIATFNAVPIGTYTITEKDSSVPYGYLVADDREVTVKYAQSIDVEIFNLEDPNIPLTNSVNNKVTIFSMCCLASLVLIVGVRIIKVCRKEK